MVVVRKSIFSILILLTSILLSGCEVADTGTPDPTDDDRGEIITLPGKVGEDTPFLSYKGLDLEGNERQCIDQFGSICTSEFTESDQFAFDCEDNGDFPVQCGCHDWICVTKEYSKTPPVKNTLYGYDISGTLSECSKFDSNKVMCTEVFTDEDQFAMNCRDAGFTATQCGCHSWVCSEMP